MTKIFFSLILTFLASCLGAQVTLDTVLVSAAKGKTSLLGANRNVQVIGGEALKNAPVQSVAQLLDFLPGIDARQRGMNGTQTDLSIRGGTFEQVLVLLDGTRLTDPQTGHHLMNLPISMDQIERIEVLLGGGSYLFEGSAFSGVVNIISKEARQNATRLRGAYGAFRSYRFGVSQDFKGEDHRSSFSFQRTASEGFMRNTDFDQNNVFAQSEIDLNQQKLRLKGGYSWQNFGAQNFYSFAYPDQYEKTRTLFASANLQSGEKLKVEREVYWRRHWDEFQLFREAGDDFYTYDEGYFIMDTDTAPSWYAGHNYHRSDVLGGKLNFSYQSNWGQSHLSLDYRMDRIRSNNLGEPLHQAISIRDARGSYTLGAERHNFSVAVEQQKQWQNLSASLALQVNHNTAFSTDLYPAVTFGYALRDDQRIYGSLNRSFRLPSYTDLYYNLGGAQGSLGLQPEKSLNYELGYKWQRKNSFMNISAFRREGRDIIDWIQTCNTCNLVASNTSVVNINGAELNLTFTQLVDLPFLQIDRVDLGSQYYFNDEQNRDYQSLYVYDYLRFKETLNLQFGFIKGLKLNTGLSFQKRNGQFTNANGQVEQYQAVWLWNARLNYQVGDWQFYLQGQNLLDQDFYDRGGVRLPGLWWWSGVALKL